MKANDRRGERSEGGLQNELNLRDINREKRWRQEGGGQAEIKKSEKTGRGDAPTM